MIKQCSCKSPFCRERNTAFGIILAIQTNVQPPKVIGIEDILDG